MQKRCKDSPLVAIPDPKEFAMANPYIEGQQMRLRNVPGAKEKLETYTNIVIPDPKNHKGKWNELFCNDHPIHIEIGMGKGQFIIGMAKMFPKINFVGIEKFDSVLVRGLEKLIEDPLPNVRLLRVDALHLTDYFGKDEISRVYLNFSDPWPKDRHAKRRLTHAAFLDRYKEILTKNGDIWFKSDNRTLFEFSLISLHEYGMKFDELCLNLHDDEPDHNVRTEYEETWSAKGYPIYRIVVSFPKEKETK